MFYLKKTARPIRKRMMICNLPKASLFMVFLTPMKIDKATKMITSKTEKEGNKFNKIHIIQTYIKLMILWDMMLLASFMIKASIQGQRMIKIQSILKAFIMRMMVLLVVGKNQSDPTMIKETPSMKILPAITIRWTRDMMKKRFILEATILTKNLSLEGKILLQSTILYWQVLTQIYLVFLTHSLKMAQNFPQIIVD